MFEIEIAWAPMSRAVMMTQGSLRHRIQGVMSWS
jgi:hypothetical protein